MKRTTEQESVILTEHPRFAVRAAAGSGKTSVLVERYLRQVVDLKCPPESIVTVTFTRKAAAEMKSRIVKRLRDLGRPGDAQAAETGPIQTVHSFCERLLRENSIEACVDPKFEVLEESRAIELRENAVRQSLLAASEDHALAGALVDRLSGTGSFKGSAASHSQLRNLVSDTLNKFRGTGLNQTALQSRYESVSSTVEFWFQSICSDYATELTSGLAANSDWGCELHRRLKDRKTKAPSWLKLQTWGADLLAAEDAVGLVWLTLTAWEFLESEMERMQEFDFPYLEKRAVSLVSESEFVRQRLARTVQALLVDEAQDLNPVQYRLLDSVKTASEMMVGDPQQSIYGFRFADRRLFAERCGSVETFQLSVNHRSQPGVLHFVDAVFAPQWGEEHTSMVPKATDQNDPFVTAESAHYDGVELWPAAKNDTATVAALVHQMVTEGVSPSEIAVLTRGAAFINALGPQLTRIGVPNRSVGASVKFYTRLEVRDISNALEALSEPRNDFSLLAVLRSPFVGLSLDAVVWFAAQPPVVDALYRPNPFGSIDQEKLERFLVWFEQGRRTADRIPAWETISFLLSETPYYGEIAKRPSPIQAIANVRKLLSMAAEEPETNAREFARRIREVQFLRHGEGEAPTLDESVEAVTMMNIHKSKGLEFDVVVLPDTYSRFRSNKRLVATDPPHGLIVPGLRKPMSAAYQWLSTRVGEREVEEELRVLYVAMTRAKKRLCVVVSEQGGDSNAAELVALRTGYPKNTVPGLMVRRLSDTAE